MTMPSYIQELLGPVEIPWCEERHTRVPLGICQWTAKNNPAYSSLEQSEWGVTELHGGLSGGYMGVNKTLDKVRQRYYWLQARNDVEK
jgi:hypothetical protein